MLGWFVAKYPDFFNVDDIPDLQAKELTSTVAVNDFEVVLLAMKNLKLPKLTGFPFRSIAGGNLGSCMGQAIGSKREWSVKKQRRSQTGRKRSAPSRESRLWDGPAAIEFDYA